MVPNQIRFHCATMGPPHSSFSSFLSTLAIRYPLPSPPLSLITFPPAPPCKELPHLPLLGHIEWSTVHFHLVLTFREPCLEKWKEKRWWAFNLQGKERRGKSVLQSLLVDPLSLFDNFFFFCLFRVAPTAYGSSQARGWIGAATAGLHHSHSNLGSEPHLQPTPQLTATPDP